MVRGDRADFPDGIQDSRRCLAMDDRDQIGRGILQHAAHLLWLDGTPPFDVETRHGAAISRQHVGQSLAEVAGDDRQRAAARRDDVGDRRFHGRCAGARYSQDPRIGAGTKHARQPRANVIEQRQQIGVEMRTRRGPERRAHTIGDRRRARAEKQARSRRQRHI